MSVLRLGLDLLYEWPLWKGIKNMQRDNDQRPVDQDRYRGTKQCYSPHQLVTLKKERFWIPYKFQQRTKQSILETSFWDHNMPPESCWWEASSGEKASFQREDLLKKQVSFVLGTNSFTLSSSLSVSLHFCESALFYLISCYIYT